jgi:opacity protein-like surface antigen
MQGTSPSAGTLGTFRQTFSSWLGYSVNLGYSRISERYLSPDFYYHYSNQFNVDSNMYESTISYVAHTPVNKRFALFGDIGPGLLTFLPVHRGVDAVNFAPGQQASLVPGVQFRPAGVAGAGIDLHLTRRFDLRAEYRGLLYKNPDFQTGDAPYSKQLTLTNEPTISLVYHFRAQ